MPEPFIQVTNLTKTYDTPAGPLNVLRGIDLRIQSSDLISIQGQSGSGKSTLLHILGTIDRPTRGSLEIEGQLTKATLQRWLGHLEVARPHS